MYAGVGPLLHENLHLIVKGVGITTCNRKKQLMLRKKQCFKRKDHLRLQTMFTFRAKRR